MTLRRSARLLAAGLLHHSGGSRLLRRMRRDRVCVLCLHRVLPRGQAQDTNSLPGMILHEQTFARMLEYLQRHFEIISLEHFLEDGNTGSAKPRCLITFDDGWKDNYQIAFPTLHRAGIPAVIFLATGLIDSTDTFWVERLRSGLRDEAVRQLAKERLAAVLPGSTAVLDVEDIIERLKRKPSTERDKLLRGLLPEQAPYGSDQMLSWEEIREMAAGGVAFGGHTDTHPLLPYEDDATVERELALCRSKIEAETGKPARAFAYPNGDWDPRVRALVQRSGFACAFGTRAGWHGENEDRFTINRIMIHEGAVTGPDGRFSPAALEFKLTGWR